VRGPPISRRVPSPASAPSPVRARINLRSNSSHRASSSDHAVVVSEPCVFERAEACALLRNGIKNIEKVARIVPARGASRSARRPCPGGGWPSPAQGGRSSPRLNCSEDAQRNLAAGHHVGGHEGAGHLFFRSSQPAAGACGRSRRLGCRGHTSAGMRKEPGRQRLEPLSKK
jgi:hypothetical protein